MNIHAASAVFPSGPGMALAATAMATRMTLHRQHPFYVDRCGQRVQAAFFPEPAGFGVERWAALAQAALQDLNAQCPAALAAGRIVLWLVLPQAARPGVPAGLAAHLAQVCRAGPFTLHRGNVAYGGHAAAVHALQDAGQALRDQRCEAALVLALDSWLHPDALQWLEGEGLLHAAGRRHSSGMQRNPYGRIPAEGAAAVLLSAQPGGWCRLAGLGLADEAIVRTDTRPCTGLAQTQAAQRALQGLQSLSEGTRIAQLVSDMNGEAYRADQFGFTALRIAPHLRAGWQQSAPALVTGDLGTATSLTHVALCAHALRESSGEDAAPALLLSGSDDALRAAVLLCPA